MSNRVRTMVAAMLALLVGIGGGGAAAWHLRRPIAAAEETTFLNFDAETTTSDVLTFGWAGYEHDDHNNSFVWCTSLQCSLLVSTHGDKDRRLSVRFWPYRFANAPPQTVTANVNGIVVGTMTFKDDPLVWDLNVEKGVWREGKNAVRFDFAYAEAPSAHNVGSNDQRTLAAGFDWIEIL